MIGAQVTITSTAALIVNGINGTVNYPVSVVLKNPTAGATAVFLGGSNVDNATHSYILDAGDIISLDLVNESLWAVVTTGTQAISVLRRGN